MNIWMIGKSLMKNIVRKFYINFTMEETTDVYYQHGKRVCQDFETKNLGEYHDLYLQRDT